MSVEDDFMTLRTALGVDAHEDVIDAYWRIYAELVARNFAYREWHDKALDLLAEREAVVPNRPTD